MSLHAAAQHIAQKGRGRDKMLVHMTPREVQGLQALAKFKGGSLSTNPNTGLPEAGFLEDILPVVAAAAATYFTAGAATPALISAGMGPTTASIIAGAGSGALIGGASSAIQGGDFGRGALTGGIGGALMGGISGFGGAPGGDVTTSQLVSEPNALAAEATKATAAAPVQTAAPVQQLSVPADVAATGGAPAVPSNAPYNPNVLSTPPGTPAQAMTPGPGQGINEYGDIYTRLTPQSAAAPQTAGTQTGKGGLGDWWNSQSDWSKAGYSTAGALGLAALNAPPNTLPTNAEEESMLKRISPNFRAQQPVQPNPYYRAQYPVYAGGGIVALANGGGPVERMSIMNTAMNPQGGMYPQGMIDKTQYATPTQRPAGMEIVETEPAYQRSNPLIGVAGMARGGIADLGGYSDGGRMLKGPGDGMSDSIPAVIGRKQPARLADGEFVVPADVVSHLGNGSTDAGAKKLYAMMDKVRAARTGKKKQAPAVNTDKFIPRMA